MGFFPENSRLRGKRPEGPPIPPSQRMPGMRPEGLAPTGGSGNMNIARGNQPGFDPGVSPSGGNQQDWNTQIMSGANPWMPTYTLHQTQPTGRKTELTWAPSGSRPEFGDIPEFDMPEWDEGEIESLTQRRAAPGIRRLRETVQAAIRQSSYGTPQQQRMTLREALQGYGSGLESVLGGAGETARSEYGQKYAREFAGEQMEYQAEINRLNAMFQASMQEFLRGGTQTETTSMTYGNEDMVPTLFNRPNY